MPVARTLGGPPIPRAAPPTLLAAIGQPHDPDEAFAVLAYHKRHEFDCMPEDPITSRRAQSMLTRPGAANRLGAAGAGPGSRWEGPVGRAQARPAMTEVGHEVRTLQCADDAQSPIAYRRAEHGQWEGTRRRQGPGVRPPPRRRSPPRPPNPNQTAPSRPHQIPLAIHPRSQTRFSGPASDCRKQSKRSLPSSSARHCSYTALAGSATSWAAVASK